MRHRMLNLVNNTFKSFPINKSDIRYGVVVNIAVSHTAAGGSIPPIGITFCIFINQFYQN